MGSEMCIRDRARQGRAAWRQGMGKSDGMGKEDDPARAKVPAAGQASAARFVALHRACVHLAIVCVGVPANALRERDTSWRICRLARHRALMGTSGGLPVAVPTAAAVVPGESDHTAETSLSKTPLTALPSLPLGEGVARSLSLIHI